MASTSANNPGAWTPSSLVTKMCIVKKSLWGITVDVFAVKTMHECDENFRDSDPHSIIAQSYSEIVSLCD